MPEEKKKILILTGDAGLGHRSAAEAIQKAFQIRYQGQCETRIENPFNDPQVPKVIRESQSDYDEVVKKLPELYKFAYEISDSDLPVAFMEGGFSVILLKILREMISETQPDIIISTYPTYMAPLQNLFESDGFEIPVITVVTDLITVHHVWFNDDVIRCTVPTNDVRQLALEAGLSEEQVIETGIPVDPEIAQLKKADVAELRTELGWEVSPIGVLVVGSPRIPSLTNIIHTLDVSGHDLQLALVAGGNKDLLSSFKDMTWNHPTKIYDFIDFMPKLMRAADLIICKAGGLIVTESLASGLPLMLVHVLPGQEIGNVNFVVDNGAGVMCDSPIEALETLSHWLRDDGAKLKEVAENAARIGRPDAALMIAEEAWQILQ